MIIRITQIEGESKQGVTQPLFCVGDDGKRYVVKGQSAGRLAMIREWIAARLGHALELPIPLCVQMELEPDLLKYDVTGYAARIGKGTVFGSLRAENVNEFHYTQVSLVTDELRARVLLFDWWLGNADRLLTESGGNPNLLWNISENALVVIDHNLTFDLSLCDDFWIGHIFKDDAKHWLPTFRVEHAKRLRKALEQLPALWKELADDWTGDYAGIELGQVEDLLWRFDRAPDSFWNHP